MTKVILAVNIGSSTIKFKVFGHEECLPIFVEGAITNIGKEPVLMISEGEMELREQVFVKEPEEMIKHIFSWIDLNKSDLDIVTIGHRIAHGGTTFKEPVVVTDEVINKLQALSSLVPLHQSYSVKTIQLARKWKPKAKQIACFDTSFHSNHSPLFSTYALPQALRDQGLRQYGFHGLSYEWIVRALKKDYPQIAQGRIIVAHLGSGASLCAIKDGKSIDTTMGMTALDGLPMNTRCGSLDPGAVLFMMKDLGMSSEQIEYTLYQCSGLKALSGTSGDVKTLSDTPSAHSKFAIDYFCLKTAQHAGKMAVAIGGVDAIVFTGGIGENSSEIRNAIVNHLKFMMPFDTLVIPTNEERMIAIHAFNKG